jgi:hypothetical protein
MADGVGPVLEHGLELDVLEPGRGHRVCEERRERPFFTEHARDPADLADQLDRSVEVERVQHARRDRRFDPYIHCISSFLDRSAHEQLYGM